MVSLGPIVGLQVPVTFTLSDTSEDPARTVQIETKLELPEILFADVQTEFRNAIDIVYVRFESLIG